MSTKIKLSDKQKEVITLMRDGYILHWIGGINPYCFLSAQYSFKVSVPTCLKIIEYKLAEREHNDGGNTKISLTELGKTIKL
jgi:hypothetical protein